MGRAFDLYEEIYMYGEACKADTLEEIEYSYI